jgi:TP901 family phage tail tape measure protein
MADDTLKLQADATQYVQQLDLAAAALDRIYAKQEKLIQQSTQLNTKTGQTQQTVTALGKNNEIVSTTFEKTAKGYKVAGVSAEVLSKNLKGVNEDLNKVGASAARNAIRVGEFTKATIAAKQIPQSALRKQVLGEIETAKVQQPLDVKNFTRNLRRDFEKEINQLPTVARNSFKQIEREATTTAAQMGLTWEQFNKRFIAARTGPTPFGLTGEEAKLQKQLIALGGEYDKLTTAQIKQARALEQTRVTREASTRGLQLEREAQRVSREASVRNMELEKKATADAVEARRRWIADLIRADQLQKVSTITPESTAGIDRARTNAAQFLAQLRKGQLVPLGQVDRESEQLNAVNKALGLKAEKVATVTSQYRVATATGEKWIATIKTQNGAIVGFTKEIDKTEEAAKRFLLSWQSVIRLLTIQILHQAVSSLIASIQQAVEAAKNLQINIALIQTISERNTGVKEWAKGILAVSDATGLLAEDVAKGTYDTLSNQIADGAEALEFMSKAGKFAVTTNSTLQESVNALSSAINSYGLSTKDTTRISDIFFRMIDLGRIQAKDFSNEIGRILPGAQQLGIRLEEVAAVLSTLTRSGVTPASAMTSLFNIFSRLLKPAGEMKEFLKQLGVTSGQAAIQTYGFAQVLAKVAEFAQGKPEILAQLFPDIRGLRGILRLAGDGLKDFKADLLGIEAAAGATDKALESFANNTGKRFQIEMNKIKNYFTATFGTSIMEGILDISDAVGGLSSILKTLGTQLTFIGAVITPVLIGRIAASFIAAATGAELLTLRIATLTTFLKANPLGLIAVAIAAVVAAFAQSANNAADQFDKMQEHLDEFLKKAREAAEVDTEKTLKPLDEAIAKQTTTLNLFLAKINLAYDAMSKDLITKNEAIMESFKEVHASFTNYLSDALNKLKEDMRATKDALKDIKNFELTGQMKIDERIRKIRLDDAETAIEKQKLLNEELAITQKEMSQEQNRDRRVALDEKAQSIIEDLHKLDREQDKEAVKNEKERVKAIQEKKKLEQELIDIAKKERIAELEKQKKINAESKKRTVVTAGGKIINPVGVNQQLIEGKDAFGDEQLKQRTEEVKAKLREINAALADSSGKYRAQNDLVGDLKKLKEEMLRLDREQAEREKEKLEIFEKQQRELKQAIKDANEAAKEVEAVKFDKLVDPKTTQEDFDKIVGAGNKAVEKLGGITKKFAGVDFENKVQYEKELAKVRESFEETAKLARKRRAAEDIARQITELNTIQQERRKKLQEEMNERRRLIAGIQTSIESEIPKITEIQEFFKGAKRAGGSAESSAALNRLVEQVITVINKIKGGAATQENFNVLRDLRIQVVRAQSTTGGRTGIELGKLENIIGEITKREAAIIVQDKKIADLNTQIQGMITSIDALTKTMSEKFGIDLGKLFENSQNINKIVKNTEDIVQTLIDGFSGQLSGLSPEARKEALSTEAPTVGKPKETIVPIPASGVPSGPPEGWSPTEPVMITAPKTAPLPVIITDENGKKVITNVVPQAPVTIPVQTVQLPKKEPVTVALPNKVIPVQVIEPTNKATVQLPKKPGLNNVIDFGPELTPQRPHLTPEQAQQGLLEALQLRDVIAKQIKESRNTVVTQTPQEIKAIEETVLIGIESSIAELPQIMHDGFAVIPKTLKEMMDETARALNAQEVENKAKAAAADAKRVADALSFNSARFTDAINNEAVAINRLSDVLASTQATVNLPPKPQAMGGFMHGKDNIPALLSKGEFVVNAGATRRFYSQLVSMNRVQGYAGGGLVTNVGDINVSMASSGNAQADIVAIGKGLRREIRRGRIKLS